MPPVLPLGCSSCSSGDTTPAFPRAPPSSSKYIWNINLSPEATPRLGSRSSSPICRLAHAAPRPLLPERHQAGADLPQAHCHHSRAPRSAPQHTAPRAPPRTLSSINMANKQMHLWSPSAQPQELKGIRNSGATGCPRPFLSAAHHDLLIPKPCFCPLMARQTEIPNEIHLNRSNPGKKINPDYATKSLPKSQNSSHLCFT